MKKFLIISLVFLISLIFALNSSAQIIRSGAGFHVPLTIGQVAIAEVSGVAAVLNDTADAVRAEIRSEMEDSVDAIVTHVAGDASFGDGAFTVTESDSTVEAETDLVVKGDLDIRGAAKPHLDLFCFDFMTDADFVPDYKDTIQVSGKRDSIDGKYYQSIKFAVPDSTSATLDGRCSEIQYVDVWSKTIDVLPYYAGGDSFVFDYYTSAGIDSSNIQVIINAIVDDDTVFCDSTTVVSSVGAWTHVNLDALDAIVRYGKFEIHFIPGSLDYDDYIIISRMKFYWEKGA